jgi:peptidoglycan L-alanyl-D-glutamate endopeptidase CwlK
MPKYSVISEERLKTCHRDLQILFRHVIQDYDNSILCGHRGEKDQNEAFAIGNSQVKFPNSKHNYIPSLAVDAVPYEGRADFDKTQSAYFAGQVMGIANQLFRIGTISHKIKCGIDWDNDNDINDTKFWDAGHFEIIPNQYDK